mmetsp:Transcript_35053/g.81076  ORF Transcript_35053/g.81076 Transcript_35053/m.81076 type:complete len:337 (+) Transcript_35053:911-1921(+)
MVVGDDGDGLDARRDQKVHQDALHLGLSRFEIVPRNKYFFFGGQLHDPRHEGVLWRSVDEGASLQNGRHRETRGGRHLRLVALDGGQEVLGRIVDALLYGGETLRVGRPQHDNFVEAVFFLKIANVGADVVHLFLFRSGEDVVGTFPLIRRDEVREIHGRHRNDLLHMRIELFLQRHVQHFRPFHRLSQIHGRDIPAAPRHGVHVHHGQHVGHGRVHGVPRGVVAQLHGAGEHHRAPVVRFRRALFRFPCHLQPVGDGAGHAGAAVVPAQADEEDAHFPDFLLGAELHLGCDGFHHVAFHDGAVVSVLCDNFIVRIGDVLALHPEFPIQIDKRTHD